MVDIANHDNKEKKRAFTLQFNEILPNNERVAHKNDLIKKRELEEIRLKEIEKEKEEKDLFYSEQEAKKDEEEKKRHHEEEKRLEKDQINAIKSIEKGQGNMNNILEQIYKNTSTYEISFAGLDLDKWDFDCLMIILPDNKSLHTLNLSRKGLTDDRAFSICEMLKQNKTLKRLELEGNLFGPDSCKYFSEALKVNQTLRYLDLENNNLTKGGTSFNNFIEFAKNLKENKILTSLNLSNNALNDTCITNLTLMLQANKKIIYLEVSQNHSYYNADKDDPNNKSNVKYSSVGASINHLGQLKQKIAENRELDRKERLKEWKERKSMTNENNEVRNVDTILSQNKFEYEAKMNEKLRVLDFYKSKFDDEVKAIDDQMNQDIEDFFIETKARLLKKPKRGKKPKKK